MIPASPEKSTRIADMLRTRVCGRVSAARGFSVIEVALAAALFGLIITSLIGSYLYGIEATALAGNRARAVMLAEEGIEAARNIRDADYANLTDGTYGLTTASNRWNLSGSSDTTGIFTRQVVISTVDAFRKNVGATVTWPQNPQRTGLVSVASELTHWQQALGIGNWATTTLAAQINLSGAQDGLKIQVQGSYAYMTRNINGSANFLVIDISNAAAPSVVGSMSLSGTPQNLAVSGSYAYVVSADDNQELQIVDISSAASPSLAGSYNAPGSANTNGVAVVGSTAYIVRASSGNNEFNIINVSVPALPVFLGSLDLGGNGNDVVISGSYAFVSTQDNAQEMKVITVSVPALPTLAGFLDLPGSTDAGALALAGTVAYIAQGSTLYTVNVTAPAAPSQFGSISAGGAVNDIALNLGNSIYLFIATSNNSAEFQVIDVSSPASLTLFGSRDVTGTSPLLGIAYDQSLDRVFAVGQSDAQELLVIAPQ